MKIPYALICCICFSMSMASQESQTIIGKVLDRQSQQPLPDVSVTMGNLELPFKTDAQGYFKIVVPKSKEYELLLEIPAYESKRIPIQLNGAFTDLGVIYLTRSTMEEKADLLLTMEDADVFEDERIPISSGMLRATRDIFLSRAAFDFGQAFFRVRGYGSEEGLIMLNGIPMNKLYNGRPQWNNWGGLNDVTRNQELSYGLQPSAYSFGGLLGVTNIDMSPSGLRPGIRLSSSTSNRTYASRLMATYTAAPKNGFAYSLSASRRWSQEGYIEGTLYNAYSVFGALEYQLDKKNKLSLNSIWAVNQRGRSAAITEEVFQLAGRNYNPYWGNQEGALRNSRTRLIEEPIVMFNYTLNTTNFDFQTGIGYQFGKRSNSRVRYFNAPNPDPTYYRNLPSFYINSPIGANFIASQQARNQFQQKPQLDWDNIYAANRTQAAEGKASYLLSEDITKDQQLSISTTGSIMVNDRAEIDFGSFYQGLTSKNYAMISDLLGASFHQDVDPFSNTRNNLNDELIKEKGDSFGYKYFIKANKIETFLQFKYQGSRWDAFLSGRFSTSNYQREGLFLNERFLDTSLGNSEKVTHNTYGLKAGFAYKFSGRHQLHLEAGMVQRPPSLQNTFINPRENNEVVPNLQNEDVSNIAINYIFRFPRLTGRVSGFYTRFQNTTDINFFFVDAGVGSDFVQEVVTDFDKLHMGFEMGLRYKISSSVKVSAVAALGKYRYASDPLITINFDTAGASEEIINTEGRTHLGTAKVKGYRLAQGPQTALSFGIEYRDPTYWWMGVTTNYLANNYPHISTITRTQSFLLNPDSGLAFPEATSENVNTILKQSQLDNFYLLNMVGGKSWLWKGTYISIFASVNNVFDTVFRTGGYEQSRNGNYGQLVQDNLSGTPSFGPKYWYGFGRTYFLNLAVSF